MEGCKQDHVILDGFEAMEPIHTVQHTPVLERLGEISLE